MPVPKKKRLKQRMAFHRRNHLPLEEIKKDDRKGQFHTQAAGTLQSR